MTSWSRGRRIRTGEGRYGFWHLKQVCLHEHTGLLA